MFVGSHLSSLPALLSHVRWHSFAAPSQPCDKPGAPTPSSQISISLFKQHHATHPGTFCPRGHPYIHQQPQTCVEYAPACPGQVHTSRPKISPKYSGSPRLKRWAISLRAITPKHTVFLWLHLPQLPHSCVQQHARFVLSCLSVCISRTCAHTRPRHLHPKQRPLSSSRSQPKNPDPAEEGPTRTDFTAQGPHRQPPEPPTLFTAKVDVVVYCRSLAVFMAARKQTAGRPLRPPGSSKGLEIRRAE